MASGSSCPTCKRASLMAASVRRMPTAVVVLGFLLLVGSILGVGTGALFLFGSKLVAEQERKTPDEVREELRKAGVPEPMITRVLEPHDTPIPPDELTHLEGKQITAVVTAELGKLDSRELAGTGKFLLGLSLLGLVLGWVLRQKKRALRCAECGTVVSGA